MFFYAIPLPPIPADQASCNPSRLSFGLFPFPLGFVKTERKLTQQIIYRFTASASLSFDALR